MVYTHFCLPIPYADRARLLSEGDPPPDEGFPEGRCTRVRPG